MTSFKKPLIAIASALAVTATMLAAPALATAPVSYDLTAVNTNSGETADDAILLPVPSDNKVQTADVLHIALTDVPTGTTVTANATDALLTATVGDTVTANSGTTTASVATGTGTVADFNVYTKTTKTGKVVITVGTSTPVTYYVKGVAGSLNTIALSAPTAALDTTAKVTVTGTDVFGNVVSGATVALQVVSATATNTYSISTNDKGLAVKELAGLTVGNYDLIATATTADAVTGLTAPTNFVRGSLAIVDLNVLIATKDAELAIANAKYNALVKRFNALATQYNKKAKNKVTLIK